MINHSLLQKTIITLVVLGLLTLALMLWINTPDLFIYFNQAFCAH